MRRFGSHVGEVVHGRAYISSGYVAAAQRVAMGRHIHSLGGRYIAATDVGTTVDDLTYVRAETPHVTGLPEEWGGLGDTSVLTGLTVYLGMKAGAEAVWG